MSPADYKTGNTMVTKDCVSARTVLWWLVFTGTAMNYVIRMNINIAIVAMVQIPESKDLPEKSINSKCHHHLYKNNVSFENISRHVEGNMEEQNLYRVDWDEHKQNLVLGSPYWVYWITQTCSGFIVQHVGSKVMFGFSNYIMCLLGVLIPFATYNSFHFLIAIRILQGIFGGFVWPSLHSVTASWIPPNERSKFISSYTGNSLGTTLTYLLCGQLIHWFGWPSVFYVTGVLGTVWFGVWWFLMYDTPEKHPRISQSEREYIQKHVGNTLSKERLPIPWTEILTSVPVWLVFLTQWGSIWCLYTVLLHAPTYLSNVHGWDIQMTGLLSALPHVLRILFAYGFSAIFDYLLTRNIMSITPVRKLAIAICCLGQGIFMLGMAFSGCDSTAAVICMTLSVAFNGVETSGQLPSMVDLSPNFASILMAVGNGVSFFTAFIIPTTVGYFTYQNQTPNAWMKVFIIGAVMAFVPDLLHLAFGSSDLQKWNSPKISLKEMEKSQSEEEKLNPNCTFIKDELNT